MTEAIPLPLRELHQSIGARFTAVNGAEVVADYGDAAVECAALTQTAGVVDLSFRGRVCLTGADRARFLHGQVTNDVKKLRPGEGCYAALVTAKGKMQSDLNVYALADELLLDFEPGLTKPISERLEKYIVADDVQVVDVAPHYGLVSVQGPLSEAAVKALGFFSDIPTRPLSFVKATDAMLGELYLVNHPRLDGVICGVRSPASRDSAPTTTAASQSPAPLRPGYDIFVPIAGLGAVADKLIAAAKEAGGRAAGWTAFETARIEAGIPRFGQDMDESNIPLECGIEARAISYNKGCYIGQEVINRIHSIGHVNRELRRLRLPDDLTKLPSRGDKLFRDGKEVGHLTSASFSPATRTNVALGYVRREADQPGAELILQPSEGSAIPVVIA